MKITRSEFIIICIVFLSFIISAYFYPQMPDSIASHWNASGEADGYVSKFWGLFILPVISLGIAAVLLVLARTGVLRSRIEGFRAYYYGFLIVFLGFFLYLHLLTVLWNLSYGLNIMQMLAPAIGVMMYIVGKMMSNVKMNRYFGIRTPWTLNNEEVWKKTHTMGGKLFKIAGIICLFGVLFPDYAFALMFYPIIAAALIAVIYSYLKYRRITQDGQSEEIGG
ncbi:SdpI family protein [Chloroflexota bacterium]